MGDGVGGLRAAVPGDDDLVADILDRRGRHQQDRTAAVEEGGLDRRHARMTGAAARPAEHGEIEDARVGADEFVAGEKVLLPAEAGEGAAGPGDAAGEHGVLEAMAGRVGHLLPRDRVEPRHDAEMQVGGIGRDLVDADGDAFDIAVEAPRDARGPCRSRRR